MRRRCRENSGCSVASDDRTRIGRLAACSSSSYFVESLRVMAMLLESKSTDQFSTIGMLCAKTAGLENDPRPRCRRVENRYDFSHGSGEGCIERAQQGADWECSSDPAKKQRIPYSQGCFEKDLGAGLEARNVQVQ